jgi:dTDP-4-dehydrorhamnose 3,5-epimerase
VRFVATDLPGVIRVEPRIFGDARGFFFEVHHARKFAEGGIDAVFVQDNHSASSRGVLRGLHAQISHPQAKLVRVIEGEIWDVAVDIRRGSPHFGRHTAALLSAENRHQLFVPEGFAHGFVVTSERAQVEYKCTDFYAPEDEITIAWNDPDLAIPWPVAAPVLSAKDEKGRRLRELDLLPRYPSGRP